MGAKFEEEMARRERLRREEQVRLSYLSQLDALENDRDRKRQKELQTRLRQKEEMEARRERQLKQKDNQLREAKARAVLEFQKRQQEAYLRQHSEEEAETEGLQAKGAREHAIRA